MGGGAPPPIAALVLNAGLQLLNGVSYTTDEIEQTVAVNHVGTGHTLLPSLLRPTSLPDRAHCRHTSGSTHDPVTKTGLPDPNWRISPKNSGRQHFATGKMMNVLWT
ncbi:hypothetical protein BJX96DRAFT_142149 [Aspergillus floccosus]